MILDQKADRGGNVQLKEWKYEGCKIADKLQEQILSIVEILNDSSIVGNKNWLELQKYIAGELGITTGQVRTIKRMMEELDIIKKGSSERIQYSERSCYLY